ncbi:GntR family transcriptional regulator [Microbacterium sp. 179-B 1A2 NHS]|uniref:GntR family transcriptional regulator n=1 Tax=Microbacterium sp. 179-B 1A2 NHS TaxID=3142383 RepID=UPI0039A02D1E
MLHRLRGAIIDGTIAPGEQLRDAEVAAWLGVSRTPVREALLELSRSGLVSALPGRSTVVTRIDDADVRNAAAVVAAMHRVAVIEAMARFTDADLERMRIANADFVAAHAAADAVAALAADDRFHAVAVDRADNTAVRTVLALHSPVLQRAELLRFGSHDAEASAARHEELIRHCAARDAAAAAAVAERIWLDLVETA